jgi:hypothetical protein
MVNQLFIFRLVVSGSFCVWLLTSCGERTDPRASDTAGGSRSPPTQVSCSCTCSGSVLMQMCMGRETTNLGDYGSAAKCQSQLASGHRGCR